MPTKQVMVVDDDPAFLLATRVVLQSAGYDIEMAHNGREALRKMRARRPDLLVLDVVMDGMLDGVSVCEEIGCDDALRGLPTILVTSIRDSEYRTAFPQDIYLTVDKWLFKPYNPAQLVAEVNRILGGPGD